MPTDPTPAPENPAHVLTHTRYDSEGNVIDSSEFAYDPATAPDNPPDWVSEYVDPASGLIRGWWSNWSFEITYLGDEAGNVIEEPEAGPDDGPPEEPDHPQVAD